MVHYCTVQKWFVSLWQIRKESEEDKQRAVAHAVAAKIHNVERACQEADKQCHDEFEAERKRINQAHAAEISAVKKKQWVNSHYVMMMVVCNVSSFNQQFRLNVALSCMHMLSKCVTVLCVL